MTKSLEREVTPPEVYFNRRAFMRAGVTSAGAAATAVVCGMLNGVDLVETRTAEVRGVQAASDPTFVVNETKTSYESITNYNNFYEFTTDKDGVAKVAAGFQTS